MSETESAVTADKTTMDINEIMSILPHRYPFLLIDRIVDMERKKRIVAIKNVTINEQFFQGHFPGQPVMPGVLMIEAIAQTGGALLLTEVPNREGMLMLFTGIENAKFRQMVVPGDQLRIEVTVQNWRVMGPRVAVKMLGIATVDGKIACESTATCMILPRPGTASKPEAAKPEAIGPTPEAEVVHA